MTVELFEPADVRMAAAVVVRFAVFVDEQRVPAELELDAADEPGAAALHALARAETQTVLGTGRVVFEGDFARIGRMAILAGARGRGAGRAIVGALIAAARARGARRVVLDAQEHAIGFYAGLGFEPAGPRHLDAGIVHLPMERAI